MAFKPSLATYGKVIKFLSLSRKKKNIVDYEAGKMFIVENCGPIAAASLLT